jgi:hypothetical protein
MGSCFKMAAKIRIISGFLHTLNKKKSVCRIFEMKSRIEKNGKVLPSQEKIVSSHKKLEI